MKEICICAAIKTSRRTFVTGKRHFDCYSVIRKMGAKALYTADSQGFYTSKGRFVTRKQGRKLQDKAGVKSASPEGYQGDTLFSEDLY